MRMAAWKKVALLLAAAQALACYGCFGSTSEWPEPHATSQSGTEPQPFVPAVVSGGQPGAPPAAEPPPYVAPVVPDQAAFVGERKEAKPPDAVSHRGPWSVRLNRVGTGTEVAGARAGRGERFVAVTFWVRNSGEENVALASGRVAILPPTGSGGADRPGAAYNAFVRPVVLRLTDTAGKRTFPMVTVVKNALTDEGQFRGGTAFEAFNPDETKAMLYLGVRGFTKRLWISRISYATRLRAEGADVALDWKFAANPQFAMSGSGKEQAARQESDGRTVTELRYAYQAELIHKDEFEDTWVFRVPSDVTEFQLRLGDAQSIPVRLEAP
ncbi:MAG: hypothetical protein NTX87_07970 [Planctomycetota bacterium]|nr:hypothetical protein [Planctomycetota bacterium]